eukprot:11891635-Ditylum_brightwellii.AAC.1
MPRKCERLPNSTFFYSASRCVEYPPFRRVLNTIEYAPLRRGMSILSTRSTPPSGGASILSTQPYQGRMIVYVMCNPTALV